ncbi:uncharacterized protein [Anabrus simplex]|uniref:uncharacterized protein isoform X1 n=1 Tax=Anabrus simplex TaxID=316456 RepID=UPI0035A33B51
MFHYLCMLLVAIAGSDAVKITDLRVPPAVRNGSGGALLDCEYSLRQEELKPDSGLVVKWFFNNEPAPVYQWIPGQKPQELGILQGRLNLGYRASDHRSAMHRALYIVNPTIELSGEYKCFVSTFKDEDFLTKNMVVFAPGENLRVVGEVVDKDNVNISCSAENVYPKPEMLLYQLGVKDNRTQQLRGVKGLSTMHSGLFEIHANQLLHHTQLSTPTEFECELSIPEVNYKVTKDLEYYPG